MSGIEIAGIGLAILPLLISAAEHYNDASTPFQRYRKYNDHVKSFQTKLDVERASFCDLILLLFKAAGHDAGEAVPPQDDAIWTDPNVAIKLELHLRSRKALVLQVLQAIQGQLDGLSEEQNALVEALPSAPGASHVAQFLLP